MRRAAHDATEMHSDCVVCWWCSRDLRGTLRLHGLDGAAVETSARDWRLADAAGALQEERGFWGLGFRV